MNGSADRLQIFLKKLSEHSGIDSEVRYYDLWIDGYHCIFLSVDNNGGWGNMSDTQLEWFQKTLAEGRNGKPIFVMMHHPMINTTSGSSEELPWYGFGKELSATITGILREYPETLLFNGHTHWTMDSEDNLYIDPVNGFPIFNTASVGYLWQSYDIAEGEGLEGSQGYYAYLYQDQVLIRGRDFTTGEWISSAQYVIDIPKLPGDLNGDGAVDLRDVIRLLQYLVGYDVELNGSADISQDGRTSIYDAVMLLKQVSV